MRMKKPDSGTTFLLVCGAIMVGLSLYDIATNPLPVFRSFYMLPIGVAVLGFGLLRLLRRDTTRP
jgi:hypothetical protein